MDMRGDILVKGTRGASPRNPKAEVIGRVAEEFSRLTATSTA